MELQNNISDYIAKCFHTTGETISMAESVTSGLIQFTFSQMEKASEFFKGGITAYTLEEKVRLLGIDRQEAEKCDCVSKKISQDMAVSAAEMFRSDWGIGITGYAVPVEKSNFKVYAYFSFSYKGEVIVSKKLELDEKTVGINAQTYYTEFILGCLKCELDKLIVCNRCQK